MPSKTQTNAQRFKALLDEMDHLASLPYKKGPRVRAIEREFRQFKALANECDATATELYQVIYSNLPTDELREIFSLFAVLYKIKPSSITPEWYVILAEQNKRAKSLLKGRAKKVSPAPRAKKST